jgi:beta-lactamase class A
LIAWATVDPASGEVEHEDGEAVFAAASTIKLFIYSAYRRAGLRDEHVRAPATGGSGVAEHLETRLSLADHAFLMLAVSDNASTNLLLDRLGDDAVTAELERLELGHTRLRRRMMADGPENETTPLDLAHGLARLLDEPYRQELLAALRVAAMAESYLPHLLPDVSVAAKYGDITGKVRHEVAYLEQGERTLVTAVCSSPPARPDEVAAAAAARWDATSRS